MSLEMPLKPIGPQSARPLRARHDFQLRFAAKFRKRLLVQPDHRVIVSTHDEQRRRLHTRQRVTREIGTSAARDYGIDPLPDFGRSHQRCTAADARSEIADAEIARRRLHDEPPRHFREPASQQADVETQTRRDIVPDLSSALSRSKSSVPLPDSRMTRATN